MAEYIFEIGEALYNEKTGEAVMKPTYKGKIVRCRECKWYQAINFFGREATVCKRMCCDVAEYEFCSRGERRNEDE